jgi:hypothetical protein
LNKSEHVDTPHKRVKNKCIPAFVFLIKDRIDGVTGHKRIHQVAHIFHCFLVVLLGCTIGVRVRIFKFKIRESLDFSKF